MDGGRAAFARVETSRSYPDDDVSPPPPTPPSPPPPPPPPAFTAGLPSEEDLLC